MPQTNFIAFGKNDQGNEIRILVESSGLTDGQGNTLWQLAVANAQPVSLGVSGAAFHSANQSATPAAVTDAPATGKHLVVTNLIVSAGAAMVVTFTEETSGTSLLVISMAANSTVPVPLGAGITLPTINKRLMVQTSATGNIDVQAQFYSA